MKSIKHFFIIIIICSILLFTACTNKKSTISFSSTNPVSTENTTNITTINSTFPTDDTDIITTSSLDISNTTIFTLIVNINVNTNNYTVEKNNDNYTASLTSDANFSTITITVVINNDINFDKVDFIVNDILISKDKYELNNHTIIYKMNDPNWTDIY